VANVGKIDQKELRRLLDEKKTNKQIAEHFGVTPGAVSQAVRRLEVALAATVATRVIAPPTRVTPVALQAAGEIVKRRNRSLEMLEKRMNKLDGHLLWIEQTVTPANDGEYRQWLEQIVKHTAEIRKIITAAVDAATKIYNMTMVEQALIVTLEEIKSESPECQKRIRDRLARANIHFPICG
jgi:IS30 family transposase